MHAKHLAHRAALLLAVALVVAEYLREKHLAPQWPTSAGCDRCYFGTEQLVPFESGLCVLSSFFCRFDLGAEQLVEVVRQQRRCAGFDDVFDL